MLYRFYLQKPNEILGTLKYKTTFCVFVLVFRAVLFWFLDTYFNITIPRTFGQQNHITRSIFLVRKNYEDIYILLKVIAPQLRRLFRKMFGDGAVSSRANIGSCQAIFPETLVFVSRGKQNH